jgi:hypothetical protein
VLDDHPAGFEHRQSGAAFETARIDVVDQKGEPGDHARLVGVDASCLREVADGGSEPPLRLLRDTAQLMYYGSHGGLELPTLEQTCATIDRLRGLGCLRALSHVGGLLRRRGRASETSHYGNGEREREPDVHGSQRQHRWLPSLSLCSEQ